MAQYTLSPQRRSISLSVRVSLWLVFAALIPLLISLIFSEWYNRPMLTNQANAAMESDTRAHLQLIDTYFQERLLDIQTLSQVPSVQTFLDTPPAPESPIYKDMAVHASYSLAAGMFRDKRYSNWSIFDKNGHLVLTYPQTQPPKPHGEFLVPPEDKQAVQAGKTFISHVYYQPDTKSASTDLYAPIVVTPTSGLQPAGRFLGFIRATLNLDYIWKTVNEENGNNGSGSYGFILDENGVYIASSDPTLRFASVSSLPEDEAQRARDEARYGPNKTPHVLADQMLQDQMSTTRKQDTFEFQPAGKQEKYQAVMHSSTILPWKYFVLSPVNTVTAVANQQLFCISLVALCMALLAVLVGIIAGRRVAAPIRVSMTSLRSSSEALNTLAVRQQDAASEQMWVVDSSQVGLQSIQYYTEATRTAAHSLSEIAKNLAQNLNQYDRDHTRQALERIIKAAQYIEQASDYQHTSNQKLATALKVATQVTEQLASGATSATEAVNQLEQVVERLRSVVGKK